MKYDNADLYQMLMELGKAEIEKVRDELKTAVPGRTDLNLICRFALRDKRDMEDRAIFAGLIQKVKADGKKPEDRATSSLADLPDRTDAGKAFYDRYRDRIAGIKTASERTGVLSDMQQYFEREARREPHNRDELSGTYQSLKQMAWEVMV